MEIVILQAAQAEIQIAYEGLAEQRGEVFIQRIDRALSLLKLNPAMAPVYGGRFRRLLVRGFPYGLFYTVSGARVFIARMMDLRQDPVRIRRELGLYLAEQDLL